MRNEQHGALEFRQRCDQHLLRRHVQMVRRFVENGKIKATWFVVPGSGTGDLSGLRGEGGFEGDFGKGSDGMLDYWFE